MRKRRRIWERGGGRRRRRRIRQPERRGCEWEEEKEKALSSVDVSGSFFLIVATWSLLTSGWIEHLGPLSDLWPLTTALLEGPVSSETLQRHWKLQLLAVQLSRAQADCEIFRSEHARAHHAGQPTHCSKNSQFLKMCNRKPGQCYDSSQGSKCGRWRIPTLMERFAVMTLITSSLKPFAQWAMSVMVGVDS